MELSKIHQHIIIEIRDHLGVVASGAPVRTIGSTFEKLSECFQALGICHLLEFADTEQYRENLIRSGQARAYQLRKHQGDVGDRHLAVSRSEALFDVAAADDPQLAREIIEHSLTDWEPTGEYEDDFCFHHFLHRIIYSQDDAGIAELESILNRFEVALEGGASMRLEVSRALASRDEIAFDENLRTLLEEQQILNETRRARLEAYEFIFWPRSFVSIEGLALLRIAEWLGMEVSDEYPLCPGIARSFSTDHGYQNLFDIIEKEVS